MKEDKSYSFNPVGVHAAIVLQAIASRISFLQNVWIG